MCPCGKAKESRTHSVGECEMYTEERDVLEAKMKIDEYDMEKFGSLDFSERRSLSLEINDGHRR